MEAVFALVTLAGGGAAVWMLRRQHMERWRAFFAQRPGFVLTGRFFPTVTFVERGVTFSLRLATARRKDGPQFHHVTVTPAPCPVAFSVRKETAGHKMLHWLGVEDIQVGDAALDRALWFQSPTPDALRSFMASRRPLVALRCFYERAGTEATLDVHREGAHIFWERQGADPEDAHKTLLGCLELVADLQAAHALGDGAAA